MGTDAFLRPGLSIRSFACQSIEYVCDAHESREPVDPFAADGARVSRAVPALVMLEDDQGNFPEFVGIGDVQQLRSDRCVRLHANAFFRRVRPWRVDEV